MTELTSGSQVIPENSITSTLLSRLQTFGWHVDAFGKIHDMFGVFSLFHVSIAEIVLRAQWAWQCVVAQQVAHRPGLRDYILLIRWIHEPSWPLFLLQIKNYFTDV